jgi:hypothetical protein
MYEARAKEYRERAETIRSAVLLSFDRQHNES